MRQDLQIDLTSVLSGEVTTLAVQEEYLPSTEQDFGDVSLKGPICVTGQISNQAGYVRLSVHVEVEYLTRCARCLADLRGQFSMDLEKTIAAKGSLADEDADEVVSDYILIEGGVLCLDEAISEQMWLEMPFRFLCSEDCRGLCPKCGKNLNEGDCSCPKKEPDPRLAQFRALLENKQ